MALDPLLKAYAIEPHLDGLEFELAFAYNALERYNEAIPVLEKAIKNDPQNFWFYRELGFSYKNLGQVQKAEDSYRQGIKLTDNKAQKAEMAINMAQAHVQLMNEEKFKEWAALTRKFTEKDSVFEQYINAWEKKFEK